jgi:uncharacterized protein YdeI (BOF family)
MRKLIIAAFATALCAAPAFADEKPSNDEAAKIKAALTEWGCEGGTYEKESEATSVFEVDDTKCKGMQYDVKLDGAFKVISITRD